MTDEALAALAEAATAGPWEASIGVTAYGYKVSGHYDPRTLGNIGTKEIVLVDVRHWSAPAFGPLLKEAEANAAFIAAARDAVPSLLARVAKAEERVKELEGALKPFADYIEPDRGMFPDHMPITSGSSIARRQLTMADCRRARAVLEKG